MGSWGAGVEVIGVSGDTMGELKLLRLRVVLHKMNCGGLETVSMGAAGPAVVVARPVSYVGYVARH